MRSVCTNRLVSRKGRSLNGITVLHKKNGHAHMLKNRTLNRAVRDRVARQPDNSRDKAASSKKTKVKNAIQKEGSHFGSISIWWGQKNTED